MRVCQSCHANISDGQGWLCLNCGVSPPCIDGVFAFAPELSDLKMGMDPSNFSNLATLESGSFWFNARNLLILSCLRKYASRAKSLLEIGCGTGFVLRAVAEAFPAWALTGSELHASGLAIARKRLRDGAEFLQLDARRLPFQEEFDVIGAFDVLEHIEEDETVIASVYKALRPGGLFVATVPQHQILWSPADDLAHHVRRYAVGELDRKVRASAMEVLFSTSFVTLLLPAMFASRRLARRAEHYEPKAEMHLGPMANRIAALVMATERAMIAAGLRLPIGGSRLLAARKAA